MKLLRTCSPAVLLIGLGVITAVVYAGMAALFPLALASGSARGYDLEELSRGRMWAAGFYVAGLLVVFTAFAIAASVARRVQRPLPIIVGFGLLFASILLWLYPVTAIDLFIYVLQGRLEVLYGLNPLSVPPSQAPLDPLFAFSGEWKNAASPYGPLWTMIGAAVVRLGFAGAFSGALAFKLLALLAFCACLFLLAWGTEYNGEALLLFAWNPLVLLQGPGNGHNDLLMSAVAALALVLWGRRHSWVAAVFVLALAASIKLPALLLAPLLLAAILARQPPGRRVWILGASALLGAATMLVAFLPYWPPWESFAGLVHSFATHRTYTLASLLRLTLGRLQVTPPYDAQLPRAVGLVIFAAGYLILLWRVWRDRIGLYTAAFWVFFLYLLTATSFRIWYPLWVIPPAVLAYAELQNSIRAARMFWRTYLLSLTSELSILIFTLLWRWVLNGAVLPRADWFWMHLLVVPWQFGLPLLAPLLIRRPPSHLSQTPPQSPVATP